VAVQSPSSYDTEVLEGNVVDVVCDKEDVAGDLLDVLQEAQVMLHRSVQEDNLEVPVHVRAVGVDCFVRGVAFRRILLAMRQTRTGSSAN